MDRPQLTVVKEVLVEREGSIGLLTLNRPDVLNALNHPLMAALLAGLEGFEKDPSVGCIVISGGARAFAAGGDIKEMEGLTPSVWAKDPHLTCWDRIGRSSKPVIAAVSGFALGGGCELAMACDMIIASETATFGQPEILIGVIPGAGGTVRLTKILGKARAMEMILTGKRLNAREALACGFVNRVAPVESYLEVAKKLAREIAGKPTIAVRAARDSIRNAIDSDIASALKFERDLFYSLFDTQDQKEGMKAFLEKREPKFTGK